MLSVVRNNRNKEFGFSALSNRICVALSRAQSGLYIVGSRVFLQGSVVWAPIVRQLHPSPDLAVCCPRHPDEVYLVCASQHYT